MVFWNMTCLARESKWATATSTNSGATSHSSTNGLRFRWPKSQPPKTWSFQSFSRSPNRAANEASTAGRFPISTSLQCKRRTPLKLSCRSSSNKAKTMISRRHLASSTPSSPLPWRTPLVASAAYPKPLTIVLAMWTPITYRRVLCRVLGAAIHSNRASQLLARSRGLLRSPSNPAAKQPSTITRSLLLRISSRSRKFSKPQWATQCSESSLTQRIKSLRGIREASDYRLILLPGSRSHSKSRRRRCARFWTTTSRSARRQSSTTTYNNSHGHARRKEYKSATR